MKNKKMVALSIIASLALIFMTIGVTVAFFNYAKNGATENTISSGTLQFHYDETSRIGAGISLEDALPMTDNEGKALTGAGKVFDFKITSKTASRIAIPYEITARSTADNIGNIVKVYLTEVGANSETQLTLSKYSELPQSTNTLANGHVEKTIYEGIVPNNQANFEKDYRLRIWIDNSMTYNPVENTIYKCDGTVTDQAGYTNCAGTATAETELTYPYENKTFTIKVNVYANGRSLTSNYLYNANEVSYTNPNPNTVCTGVNATVECALDELDGLLNN